MNGQVRIYVAAIVAAALLSGCTTEVVTTQQDAAWTQVGGGQARANARPMPEPALLPMTHFSAGRLVEEQGDFRRAAAQYERAIELNPKFVQAHNRLGIVMDRLGAFEAADKAFAAAIELQPDSAYLRNNLGFSYLLQERWVDAEATLRASLARNPNFSRARTNLGVAIAKQGRIDEAVEEMAQAMPAAAAYYNVGMLCRNDGRYAEAKDAFEQALALNGQMDIARQQLMEVDALAAAEVEAQTPEPMAEHETSGELATHVVAEQTADAEAEPAVEVEAVEASPEPIPDTPAKATDVPDEAAPVSESSIEPEAKATPVEEVIAEPVAVEHAVAAELATTVERIDTSDADVTLAPLPAVEIMEPITPATPIQCDEATTVVDEPTAAADVANGDGWLFASLLDGRQDVAVGVRVTAMGRRLAVALHGASLEASAGKLAFERTVMTGS